MKMIENYTKLMNIHHHSTSLNTMVVLGSRAGLAEDLQVTFDRFDVGWMRQISCFVAQENIKNHEEWSVHHMNHTSQYFSPIAGSCLISAWDQHASRGGTVLRRRVSWHKMLMNWCVYWLIVFLLDQDRWSRKMKSKISSMRLSKECLQMRTGARALICQGLMPQSVSKAVPMAGWCLKGRLDEVWRGDNGWTIDDVQDTSYRTLHQGACQETWPCPTIPASSIGLLSFIAPWRTTKLHLHGRGDMILAKIVHRDTTSSVRQLLGPWGYIPFVIPLLVFCELLCTRGRDTWNSRAERDGRCKECVWTLRCQELGNCQSCSSLVWPHWWMPLGWARVRETEHGTESRESLLEF